MKTHRYTKAIGDLYTHQAYENLTLEAIITEGLPPTYHLQISAHVEYKGRKRSPQLFAEVYSSFEYAKEALDRFFDNTYMIKQAISSIPSLR